MLRHHILAESSFVSLVRRGNVLPCCLSLLYARIMVESLRCSTPNPATSCCRVDVLSGMVCILLVVLRLQCFKRSPVINLVSASASAKQPLRFRLTRRPHSCMQSSHLFGSACSGGSMGGHQPSRDAGTNQPFVIY